MLIYATWYIHQRAEKALEARLAYQAELRANADAIAATSIQLPEQPGSPSLSPALSEPGAYEECDFGALKDETEQGSS